MFTIAHGPVQKIWAPVINTDTLYVGQIVVVGNEGVSPLPTALGVNDTTTKSVPFGVVVGTNRKSPLFDSTNKAEYITYADPSTAGNEDYVMTEGPWAKGDLQAMVEVALIDSTTILKGKIFNAAYGTAPAATALSGTPTTTTATSAATSTGIANLSTLYFRDGAARGSYRVTDDTSTTALTWDLPTVNAAASGDIVVRVPLRPQGESYMQVGAEGNYINSGADLSLNYYAISVVRLDLSTAGNEYCEFRFDGDHFSSVRA